MKNKTTILTLLLAMLMLSVSTVQAVDVAPRISDREIIEKLAALEAGQKALSTRIDDVNTRIDDVNTRIDDLRTDMKAGQEALSIRITSLEQTMLALFGALTALVVAMMGYMAWDRRTMIKPIIDRLDSLEMEVVRELDLRHEEGSRLTRQLKALKEYARNDAKLKEILRDLSLL